MVNSSLLPANRLRTPDADVLARGRHAGPTSDGSWPTRRSSPVPGSAWRSPASRWSPRSSSRSSPRSRSAGSASGDGPAFVVTVLVVQMIPAEGLFISQYQMLDGWGLVNRCSGLSIVYVAAILPFTIWMLRGFVAGVPIELEEAAMVDGLLADRGLLPHHLPAAGPGPGRRRGVRLPAGVERVHARAGRDDRPRPAHPAAVAAGAGRGQPGHRLGRGDGGAPRSSPCRSSCSSCSCSTG